MSKLLLFDLDSIVFTIGWRFRIKKSSNLVKLNTSKFIFDVLNNVNPDYYMGFYGAADKEDLKPNFRYDVYSKYKANRPETPDFVKKWRPVIHKEFNEKWGFIPVEGMEADDAVAIYANKYKDIHTEITIATFDKDLKQIPNITFYNMKTHKTEEISEFDAYKNFYIQMLMGDSGDNIPGLPGIGIVTAKKILNKCTTIYSMHKTVVYRYRELEHIHLNMLLKIIIKEKKDELDDVEIDTSQSEYNNLTDAKFNRKIRINFKKELQESLESFIPGGWKNYYKQQYKLLRMLIELPEDVVENTPIENVNKIPDTTKEATVSLLDDSVDDFLTV